MKCTCYFFKIRCMKRADHRGGWRGYEKLYKSIFIEKAEPATCAFAPLCVPARARPLPLQWTAPLRANIFVRAHPQRFRLQHHQTPGRVRNRIAS